MEDDAFRFDAASTAGESFPERSISKATIKRTQVRMLDGLREYRL